MAQRLTVTARAAPTTNLALPNVGVLDRIGVSCPTTLSALLEARAGGCRPLAGGTDLLVGALSSGRVADPLVWTGGVEELRNVTFDGALRVGAGATMARIVASEVSRDAPAVANGARILGSLQIRNVATLVGNLCNASPAADTVPGLAVHEALVELRSHGRGVRTLTLPEFLLGPGTTELADDEVVTQVSIEPLGDAEASHYRRFTVRRSMDLAFVGVAARIGVDPVSGFVTRASIALGAVGPTVQRVDGAAAPLLAAPLSAGAVAQVADAASEMCHPISDLRCSDSYRRHLVRVLVREVIPTAYAHAVSKVQRAASGR